MNNIRRRNLRETTSEACNKIREYQSPAQGYSKEYVETTESAREGELIENDF